MTPKTRVVVFVLYDETLDFYPKILRQLFEDHIELEVKQYSDINPVEPFDADLVLYTVNFLKRTLIEKCLNPNAEFYHMGNTLRGASLASIKNLERGTELLIVSKGSAFLWDTLLTFKAHGIDHLSFVPYYGQYMDMKPYKHAIIMGIRTFMLPEATQIIDIGWRFVHPYVLRKIGAAAALSEDYMADKINAYLQESNDLLDYYSCVEISILSEFIQERLALLNYIEIPSLLVDEQDVVYGFNERLRSEFQIDFEKVIGHKIYRNPLLDQLRSACEDRGGSGHYESSTGQRYSVSIRVIDSYGHSLRHLFLLEVTPLQKSETKGQLAYRFEDITAKSQEMKRVVELARHFADTESTILIQGPSGVGKEILAHSIHAASGRRACPFYAVNCGAFSESLLESELFGYAGGSFTGALRSGKKGLLESAHGGTVFLDEIGEASLKLQVRLLRFLQEKEVQPVGSSIVKKVDVRVICATNRDLEAAMHQQTFREDLFYRISPVTLTVPPLKDRREDVEPILEEILGSFTYDLSEPVKRFFMTYPWPGNVRELKGCAEYLLSFNTRVLGVEHLPDRYQKWILSEGRYEDAGPPQDLYDHNLEAAILRMIDQDHAGRRSLAKALSAMGFRMTEYKVSDWLNQLKASGLIQVEKGRHGTRLTEAGKSRLASLEQR